MTDALMYTDTNGDAHVIGVMSDNAEDIKFNKTGTSFTSDNVDGVLREVDSAIPNVVNNLTSTSTTDALSAYQGKLINEKLLWVDGYSKNVSLKTSFTDFDSYINNLTVSSDTLYSIENLANLTVGGYGCGNHQHILAWVNTQKSYCWFIIFNFYRIVYGKRNGNTTTTWYLVVG